VVINAGIASICTFFSVRRQINRGTLEKIFGGSETDLDGWALLLCYNIWTRFLGISGERYLKNSSYTKSSGVSGFGLN
jgi:hypothetical protein